MDELNTPRDGRKRKKQGTVVRLLVTFLPQLPLVLATLLSTSMYAGVMTARIGVVIPVLRVFVEDVSDEEREELGLHESVDVVRTLTKEDDKFSGTMGRIHRTLDVVDAFWVGAFGITGTPEHRARVGALCTACAWFVLVTILAAASNLAQLYTKALLVVRARVTLQIKLLENLLHQPLAFYNEQKRGELITRMGADVTSATICLHTLTGPLLREPLLLLAPLVFIVSVKWWLGFIVAAFLLAIMISVRKQARKVHRRAKVRQRTIGRVTEAMVQMFSGIRIVKAFGLEQAKVEQYTKRTDEFARDAMATEVTKAWTRTKIELLTNAIMVVGMLVAAVVIGGGGSVPSSALLIFVVFMAQMYRPSKVLTRSYADLVDNLAGAQRAFEFIDLEPGMPDRPTAVPLNGVAGSVVFEKVTFSYNGNGKVLDNVNLEVQAGQVVALVGHSGAGKSTLVNLVPRFYDPDEGSVSIDGMDLRDLTRESLLRNIAIVTQEPFLFNTSVRENIAYGKPGAKQDEIEAAAKAANIHDFVQDLPQGYGTVVGERGANLSGGQCQRITIARALLRDPKILILDEATSSLDTESEHAVQQALQNLMRGRTTLVIAHRLSTVQHADKICVMQDGQIAEMGTHDDLLNADSLYRRLYKLQFGDAETPART